MKSCWISRSSKVLAFFTCLLSLNIYGQLEEGIKERSNYYLFPIKPGVRNTLAGTMGELRSTHFHTGIDIRTEGRTGLPVHAAADGYVSRVSISPSGYGNAIYITHQNEEITVYAHLENLTGDLANYVRREQYRRKSGVVNLYFHKDRFPVKKGEVVAYSGNSGSSGGPHLHFDIRDKNNNPLNPLEYGFDEILDHTPPVANKIALKTLDINSRVNGQFGRFEFNVRRIGNDYVIDEPIEVYGQVGLELYAYDKLDNSRFRCGITKIEVSLDSQNIFQQQIKKLSFEDQRNILAHMSYEELQTTGHRYHKLYIDDGNELNFYKTNANNGKMSFTEDCDYNATILMEDSYHNKSKINFKLICSPAKTKINDYTKNSNSVKVIDNTLMVQMLVENNQPHVIELYVPEKQELKHAYLLNNMAVYLWDMRKGLPHSINLCNDQKILDFKDMVPSGKNYKYYNEFVDLSFSESTLFDTVYLQSKHWIDTTEAMEIFQIGDYLVPVKRHFKVTLKPQLTPLDSKKTSVYALDERNNKSYEGGSWEDGKVSFWTRSFGKYTILTDSTAPYIRPVRLNSNDLYFKISDDLSGIENYACTVNGEWVLMHYDYKRSLIWSEKLDNETFKGEVKLTLTDRAGNRSEFVTTL